MNNAKKLAAGAAVATVLALGGSAAIAAQGEDPEVKGSVTAPEGSEDEKAEGQGLEKLATIDRSAAEKAALEAVPGEAKETELENEDGSVVYEVEIAGYDGKLHEVVVDAGNGEILHQELETDEKNEGPEGDD